jgi:hypothetical protein
MQKINNKIKFLAIILVFHFNVFLLQYILYLYYYKDCLLFFIIKNYAKNMKHISFLHYFNLFLGNEPIFSKSFSISRIEIIGPSIQFYSKYLNIIFGIFKKNGNN